MSSYIVEMIDATVSIRILQDVSFRHEVLFKANTILKDVWLTYNDSFAIVRIPDDVRSDDCPGQNYFTRVPLLAREYVILSGLEHLAMAADDALHSERHEDQGEVSDPH